MRKPLFVLLVASVVVACKGEKDDANNEPEDEQTLVAEGSDASAVESDTQLVTSSLVSSSPGALDTGEGALAIYAPRECLKVAHDAAARTATYTFDHCAGPNGLRDVSGEVNVTYTRTADRLHLELTGTDLAVNNATVDWSASAEIAWSGPNRTMTWRAQLIGTTAGGRSIARTNDHTIAWKLGEPCFSLSGVSEGQINRREVRVEIDDFRRCRRACPEGTVAITNVTKNKRFEVRYDGTNLARYVAPNGRETAVPLLCRA